MQNGERRESSEHPAAPRVAWPPPGLERLQGDIWDVIRHAGHGAVVLSLPLLWAVATDQPFWSLGPFEGSWWGVAAAPIAGLLVLSAALYHLFRLFRRAALASDRGYGWLTIALVACDAARDTGFVLQGARAFSTLRPHARTTLLLARLAGAAAYLCAALWLPFGLAVGVMLAARGVLGAPGMWLITLAPAAALLLVGVGARIAERAIVRQAKRQWYTQPWSEDLAREEIRSWNDALGAATDSPAMGAGIAGIGRRLRGTAVALVVIAVVMAVPTLTLIATGSVGPALARIAIPQFANAQQDAAAAEPLRRYVLTPDPAVSPLAAGEALQVLTFVGTTRQPRAYERAPVRRYEERWFDRGDGDPTGLVPGQWPTELIRRAADEVSPEALAYLEEIAAHPAHAEIERLATAGDIDIAGARWMRPLPEDATPADISIPPVQRLREAMFAHAARAALELADGRTDEAERTIREIISVGFLLTDHGPTLIDNLLGIRIAEIGGDALESFYAATGRSDELDALRWSRRTARTTAEAAALGFVNDPPDMLRSMPRIVLDEETLPGLRWEYFTILNTVMPCLNSNRVVFGPAEEYGQWLEDARSALVRHEGDAEIFRVSQRGWLSAHVADDGGSWIRRFLSLTMGGRDSPGSCIEMLAASDG